MLYVERWRIGTDFLIMWINMNMYQGVWSCIWLSNKSAVRVRYLKPHQFRQLYVPTYAHKLYKIICEHEPSYIVSAINRYPRGDSNL